MSPENVTRPIHAGDQADIDGGARRLRHKGEMHNALRERDGLGCHVACGSNHCFAQQAAPGEAARFDQPIRALLEADDRSDGPRAVDAVGLAGTEATLDKEVLHGGDVGRCVAAATSSGGGDSSLHNEPSPRGGLHGAAEAPSKSDIGLDAATY